MTKVTIEHGGLKSVFKWDGLIGLDMADTLNAAVVSAMGEKHELDLLWTIAKIRLATGLEKPMLSELPDAISDLVDKQAAKVEEWRMKYDNLARTALEQASSLARENKLLRDELQQIATDASEHHADWIEIGPEGTAARDFAFAIADYATKALGANND